MTGIEEHPDLLALRERYERAAETAPAHAVDGLTFLSGLYLAISPWVAGFNGLPTLTINNVLTGIAVAMLAVGLASAFGRTHGVAWVVPIIGVWTIITPWVVSGDTATTSTIWNNVVTGAAIVIFGLGATMIAMMPKRR
jgi:hypothetical protein